MSHALGLLFGVGHPGGSRPRGRRAVSVICSTVALAAVVGCAPMAQVQPQLDSLNRGLADIRAIQAEQVAQLSSLEAQVRELRGKVEEVTHTQTTSIDSTLNTVQSELSNLRRRVPPPAIVPVAELEEDEGRLSELSPEIGNRFQSGLLALREGNFSAAAAAFEELYDTSFDQPIAPNALFWLAVAQEGLGNDTVAIRRYVELTTKFSKSRRAPLGLLRQGSLMIRMGDGKTARIVFRKLVADYPKSAEAARARERLKEKF